MKDTILKAMVTMAAVLAMATGALASDLAAQVTKAGDQPAAFAQPLPAGLVLAPEIGFSEGKTLNGGLLVVAPNGWGLDIYSGAKTTIGADVHVSLTSLVALAMPSVHPGFGGIYVEGGFGWKGTDAGPSVCTGGTNSGSFASIAGCSGGTVTPGKPGRDVFRGGVGGGFEFAIPVHVDTVSFKAVTVSAGYHNLKGINVSAGIQF